MNIRIILFLFVLIFIFTNDVNARLGSSRGSSSRSSGRSTGSFGGSFGHRRVGSTTFGRGSSNSHTSHSNPTSSGRIGSNPYSHGSSSSGHNIGSSGHGGLSGKHTTGTNPFGHNSSPGRHTSGSSSSGHGSSSAPTLHQQNKDSSASFLHGEGGGARRPSQTNPVQPSFQPSAPPGTYPNNKIGKPGFTTDNKQNAAPYNPSAPPSEHIPKTTLTSSQNQGSTIGQTNVPINRPNQNIPHNNPPWSNPYFKPNQPYPPASSSNVGFRNDLRQPSTSVHTSVPPHPSYPTNQRSPPYPTNQHSPPYPINQHSPPYPTNQHSPSYPINQHSPPYPTNQHSPPYPINQHSSPYSANSPFNHANQPHSTYNPSHPFPSHTIGHPSIYPNTFGNPYSTRPVGIGPYGTAGQPYYPQQHVLAQPAAQPYIPGQTIVMAPNQGNSGRGFGQMVKEALVFSTINAGVNRLLNPHHHYVMDSRPISSSGTPGETHITYNNQYYNNVPPNNSPMSPTTLDTAQGNVPVINPVNHPNSMNHPSIIPIIPSNGANNTNVTNTANNPSVSATDTMNNMNNHSHLINNESGNILSDQPALNKEATFNYPQYKISDSELWMLSEELFAKQNQEIDLSRYLMLDLQNVTSQNITDQAKRPLIYLDIKEVYDHPTILAIRALYDNYEHDSTRKETRTFAKRKEEDLLLDLFLNTNIMATAMQWLSDRGFIDPDDFEKKDVLRDIWFDHFDGATSGFERIFTSEKYGSDLLGVQDWIYFEYQESRKRIDYLGYVDILKLGDKASLLKLNFKMDDIIRPNATIFVGTLPELEMSLYTICFYARPNDLCPVSLGGSKFNIFTHSFRYYGRDLIDLALPIF